LFGISLIFFNVGTYVYKLPIWNWLSTIPQVLFLCFHFHLILGIFKFSGWYHQWPIGHLKMYCSIPVEQCIYILCEWSPEGSCVQGSKNQLPQSPCFCAISLTQREIV
jgi:hypothetical protein